MKLPVTATASFVVLALVAMTGTASAQTVGNCCPSVGVSPAVTTSIPYHAPVYRLASYVKPVAYSSSRWYDGRGYRNYGYGSNYRGYYQPYYRSYYRSYPGYYPTRYYSPYRGYDYNRYNRYNRSRPGAGVYFGW